MIEYGPVQKEKELVEILQLQVANLPKNLSAEKAQQEGFVTLVHDLPLLKSMNTPHPHIIAKEGEKVIGYALVLLQKMKHSIPLLQSMFTAIDDITIDGAQLSQQRYFVMGQICIDLSYRGKGIFAGLYTEMKKQMRKDFDYIITEIDARNTRSLRAHEKVGFVKIKAYHSDGLHWVIVQLPLNN